MQTYHDKEYNLPHGYAHSNGCNSRNCNKSHYSIILCIQDIKNELGVKQNEISANKCKWHNLFIEQSNLYLNNSLKKAGRLGKLLLFLGIKIIQKC